MLKNYTKKRMSKSPEYPYIYLKHRKADAYYLNVNPLDYNITPINLALYTFYNSPLRQLNIGAVSIRLFYGYRC